MCLQGFRKHWTRSVKLQKIWRWHCLSSPRDLGHAESGGSNEDHSCKIQSRILGSRYLGGTQGNWRQDYGSECSEGSLLGGSSAHLPAVSQTFQAQDQCEWKGKSYQGMRVLSRKAKCKYRQGFVNYLWISICDGARAPQGCSSAVTLELPRGFGCYHSASE